MSVAIKLRDEPTARRAARETERRCAVSGRRRHKAEMIRFVAAPDGSVVADILETLPGRGIWVGADRTLIERGCGRGGALARAGKTAPDLADRVERLLVERCQSIVGLARRAGELSIGQDAVRAMLRAGDAGVMIVARDASDDGRAKLERLRAAAAPGCGLVEVMDRAELGHAVGRADAVHLALRAGRLAQRLAAESGRLAGVRTRAVPGAPEQGSGRVHTKEAERQ